MVQAPAALGSPPSKVQVDGMPWPAPASFLLVSPPRAGWSQQPLISDSLVASQQFAAGVRTGPGWQLPFPAWPLWPGPSAAVSWEASSSAEAAQALECPVYGSPIEVPAGWEYPVLFWCGWVAAPGSRTPHDLSCLSEEWSASQHGLLVGRLGGTSQAAKKAAPGSWEQAEVGELCVDVAV